MREDNEAYLTSKPGEYYVIYFTSGGQVGLDVRDYNSTFRLNWLKLSAGEWISEDIIKGGQIFEIEVPKPGSWVAVISSL